MPGERLTLSSGSLTAIPGNLDPATMPESPLIEKEIAALADLESLIAARAKGETETELAFHRRREKEEHEFQSASSQLSSRYKAEMAALRG